MSDAIAALPLAPGLEAEARRQQIALLHRNAPVAILVNGINASLLAYVNYTLGVASAVAGAWACGLIAIALGRFALVRRYRQGEQDLAASERFLERYHAGTILTAGAWGAGTVVFMWNAPLPVFLFTGLVVSGTVAGGVAMLGPVFRVYRDFALLVLVPMAAAIFFQATGSFHLVFGGMTLFLLAIVLRGAALLHETVAASIRLKLEQQALAVGLAQAHDEAHDALVALREKSDALEESEGRYRLILQHSPTGIAHYNNDLVITYCNQRFAEILQAPSERLIGLDMKTLKDQRVLAALQEPLAGRTGSYEGEYISTLSDRHAWIWMSCAPLFGPNHACEGGVAIVEDISDRKALESELVRLATTDSLTSIGNRRYFLDQLATELARVRRFGTPAALLMADIDHFKQVNDTFGHATGDQVLRHFTELVRQRLRRTDHFGRLGGEEFGLLLTGTDAAGARHFAERLRRAVAETPTRTEQQAIPVSVSIGIATFAPGDATVEGILARADAALYRAKEGGRNRVEAG
jgi:diguanylate cyclase (GGDEF)-like protein/PAS domain S-box-containing protein